jgi:hypothetical protein
MQKERRDGLKQDGTLFWIVAYGACETKGATGVHRSVALNMHLVIARLFREPHLQFTWIGDGLLHGHKVASLIRKHAHAPTSVLRLP